MNCKAIGNAGEEIAAKLMLEHGIRSTKLGYKDRADFVTDNGVFVDAKYSRFPRGNRRQWIFSTRQEKADVFLCMAEMEDGSLSVFLFPKALCLSTSFGITKLEMGRGCFNEYRDNWNIITKREFNSVLVPNKTLKKEIKQTELELEEDEITLTTTEAAARLGVTAIRVRALCEKGELKASKLGRDWLIKERDLTRFSPRRVGRPKKEG